jgi:hypothetical protein
MSPPDAAAGCDFSLDERRALLTAAFLHPLSTALYGHPPTRPGLPPKAVDQPVGRWVVSDRLQRSRRDADDAAAVGAGARAFCAALGGPPEGWSRLGLALVVRNEARALWRPALHLAAALTAAAAAGAAARARARAWPRARRPRPPTARPRRPPPWPPRWPPPAGWARSCWPGTWTAYGPASRCSTATRWAPRCGVAGRDLGPYMEDMVQWQCVHPAATREDALAHLLTLRGGTPPRGGSPGQGRPPAAPPQGKPEDKQG